MPRLQFVVQTGALLMLAAAPVNTLAQSGVQEDIEQLRKQVAAQQEQINELRRMLYEQSRLLRVTTPAPVDPQSAPNPERAFKPPEPAPAAVPEPEGKNGQSPLAIGIGPIVLAPTGFIDPLRLDRGGHG